MAYMSASEPDETKRTFSAQATASQIASASSMPRAFMAKKVWPSGSCSRTASTTSGCEWPTSMGPEPISRST